MSSFGNKRASSFLESIPTSSIDNETDTLTRRSKFNFSYFDVQSAGQDFGDWSQSQLKKLLDKLKDYSKEPLSHWTKERIGKSGTVLAIYGDFPKSSEFAHPKHVPHQARWGRFRLEQSVRLVGFVLPDSYHGKAHPKTKECFDCNVFYVVFLDLDHKFYKIEDK